MGLWKSLVETSSPSSEEPPAEPVAKPLPEVTREGRPPSVVVIGAGRMGQLIAAQLALRGSEIVLHDKSDFTRERALAAVHALLLELEADHILEEGITKEAMQRITVSDSLMSTLTADLVLEAVPEDIELKREIFLSIDALLTKERTPKTDRPLLCSNSISFAPGDIFKNLKHKSWCNLRFLSPVLLIDEVELIADERNRASADVHLRALGMLSVPKMTLEKILPKERVISYYARQRVLTAAAVKALGSRRPEHRPPEAAAAKKPAKVFPDCSICLTYPSGALILPCGHTSTCHECAIQLCSPIGGRRCPICRCQIEKVLQADCPSKSETTTLDTTYNNVLNWLHR